jgi:hypothetical protein
VLQESTVHTLLSSQVLVTPTQTALLLHLSVSVQALPSSQVVPVAATLLQPLVLMQLSVVHTLPSSQLRVVPPQTPAVQTSLTVQKLLSLHSVPVCVG